MLNSWKQRPTSLSLVVVFNKDKQTKFIFLLLRIPHWFWQISLSAYAPLQITYFSESLSSRLQEQPLHSVWRMGIVGSAQICLYSTSSLTPSMHYMWMRLFTALHNYRIWSHSSLQRLGIFFSFLLISYILQRLSSLFWCCGLIGASNANLTTQAENYGWRTKELSFHGCVLRGSTWWIKAHVF